MQVTLQDRERLNQAGKGLEDIFDTLVASIQGGWDVEHLHTGRHGSVNALSVYSATGFQERDYPMVMGEPVAYTPVLSEAFTNDAAGQVTCAWTMIGKTMLLSIIMERFSVAGGAPIGHASLPSGFGGASLESFRAALVNDNGTESIGVVSCRVGEPYVRVRLPNLTNWAASVNNTSFYFSGHIAVVPLHV